MHNRATVIAAVIGLLVASGRGVAETDGAPGAPSGGHPMVVLSTTLGDITIELFPDKAPISSKNFLEYVEAGYYDGTVFHRVIPGFMIQGGGMDKDLHMKEGQRAPIRNESNNGLLNTAGSVAMARTPAPDSATSQFFINTVDNDFLNRAKAPDGVGYAVFGKVVDGMDVVKKIEAAKTSSQGPHQNVPVEPVVIKSAKVKQAAKS